MNQHHFGFLISTTFLITAFAGRGTWQRAADGSNYLIDHFSMLNWNECLLECVSKNVSMVTLGSEKKYMALKDLLEGSWQYKWKNFWLGGHYKDFTGQGLYYWTATGKEFDYTFWSPEEFKQDSDYKQCVSLTAFNFRLVSSNCDRTDIRCLCEEGPRLLENINVQYVNVSLQALDTQIEGINRTINNLIGQLANLKIALLQ